MLFDADFADTWGNEVTVVGFGVVFLLVGVTRFKMMDAR
jgi:hypothetical protein